ncbi:MAG: DDE-type integrase/transposase/recombinase [Nitrospira sp.]|nr:DDE-type integrase/transposase/recombinase [Nitrospira sp.]
MRSRGREHPGSVFTVEAPNRVWAGDLTYIWTGEGWLYLAVLLDLYSRRVVGWAMGQRLTGELAEQALTMAVMNRTPRAGLVHHSDRGSQGGFNRSTQHWVVRRIVGTC